jgi:hypothetical protein
VVGAGGGDGKKTEVINFEHTVFTPESGAAALKTFHKKNFDI